MVIVLQCDFHSYFPHLSASHHNRNAHHLPEHKCLVSSKAASLWARQASPGYLCCSCCLPASASPRFRTGSSAHRGSRTCSWTPGQGPLAAEGGHLEDRVKLQKIQGGMLERTQRTGEGEVRDTYVQCPPVLRRPRAAVARACAPTWAPPGGWSGGRTLAEMWWHFT